MPPRTLGRVFVSMHTAIRDVFAAIRMDFVEGDPKSEVSAFLSETCSRLVGLGSGF